MAKKADPSRRAFKRRERRDPNPNGIPPQSPRLLARWDRLAEKHKIAEHTYPTGRGTSYPGSTVEKIINPNGVVASLVACGTQPRWG